jgi:hypothetical protein
MKTKTILIIALSIASAAGLSYIIFFKNKSISEKQILELSALIKKSGSDMFGKLTDKEIIEKMKKISTSDYKFLYDIFSKNKTAGELDEKLKSSPVELKRVLEISAKMKTI